MSEVLRIFMIAAIILYFILIIVFIKRKTLQLKYTLLWLFAGIVMLIFTVFPMLFVNFVKMLGVTSVMNGLFSLCIFFVLIILMSLTSIVSKQSDKIRTLTQEIAILEKRIRDKEKDDDEL